MSNGVRRRASWRTKLSQLDTMGTGETIPPPLTGTPESVEIRIIRQALDQGVLMHAPPATRPRALPRRPLDETEILDRTDLAAQPAKPLRDRTCKPDGIKVRVTRGERNGVAGARALSRVKINNQNVLDRRTARAVLARVRAATRHRLVARPAPGSTWRDEEKNAAGGLLAKQSRRLLTRHPPESGGYIGRKPANTRRLIPYHRRMTDLAKVRL
jgi:hypothetical protein